MKIQSKINKIRSYFIQLSIKKSNGLFSIFYQKSEDFEVFHAFDFFEQAMAVEDVMSRAYDNFKIKLDRVQLLYTKPGKFIMTTI